MAAAAGASGDFAVLRLDRRQFLGSSALALLMSLEAANASLIKGGLPWKPGSADPPTPVAPGPWQYFSTEEAQFVEAFVDRLIPADSLSPGGKELGCAIFIDRQLAGPQGRYESYYMSGPFQEGTKQQGPQSQTTAAQQYRRAIAAIDKYCRGKFGSKLFAQLTDDQKDEVIKGLEEGSVELDGASGEEFFKLILKDTQNGFLADPIYGGNRDMASWKMIGFPGARYDYRDFVDRHNQRFPLPPVGINNHPDWK